jgi:SAM-dependent methyltransferase
VHDHHGDHVAASLPDLLDLDGEVLAAYWDGALDWVAGFVGPAPQRVLDLGSGTGVATSRLVRRYPDAEVVAVDVDEAMLARLPAGVRRVRADLDAGWPDVAELDLTWASNSLHHLHDVARVLADLFAATVSGGVVAVAEFDEPLRFLPGSEVEERCLGQLRAEHAHELPHLGDAWSARLAAAGFVVAGEREFVIEAGPSPDAARYARRGFSAWGYSSSAARTRSSSTLPVNGFSSTWSGSGISTLPPLAWPDMNRTRRPGVSRDSWSASSVPSIAGISTSVSSRSIGRSSCAARSIAAGPSAAVRTR